MNKDCKFCHQEFEAKYDLHIFCSLPCSNRSNLNNKRRVQLPIPNEEVAELFSILLGDGSVTKYFAKIYLNAVAEVEYASFVKQLAEKLFFGAPITIQQRPYKGTIEIQISSKDVCDYLRALEFDARARYVPSWITHNEQFTKAAIRGLFDTEGSVGIKYFNGKNGNYFYKQLTVTNKNGNILRFLEQSLSAFGYKPTKNSQKNIHLSNRFDIIRYMEDIKSHNPKLIRKMSIENLGNFTYGGLRRMVRHQS